MDRTSIATNDPAPVRCCAYAACLRPSTSPSFQVDRDRILRHPGKSHGLDIAQEVALDQWINQGLSGSFGEEPGTDMIISMFGGFK